jgi:hypothetical protein
MESTTVPEVVASALQTVGHAIIVTIAPTVFLNTASTTLLEAVADAL